MVTILSFQFRHFEVNDVLCKSKMFVNIYLYSSTRVRQDIFTLSKDCKRLHILATKSSWSVTSGVRSLRPMVVQNPQYKYILNLKYLLLFSHIFLGKTEYIVMKFSTGVVKSMIPWSGMQALGQDKYCWIVQMHRHMYFFFLYFYSYGW